MITSFFPISSLISLFWITVRLVYLMWNHTVFLLKLGLLFSGFLEAKADCIESSSAASPLYLKLTMVVGCYLIPHRVVNEDFNTKIEVDTQVHTVTGHAMDKWPCYLNIWIAQDNFLFLRHSQIMNCK